jgi:hypothetical protein
MDLKEFRRIGARRQKAEREAAELAERLRPLAVAALRAGVRPAEVVEITGWSAAQVRTIARVAGLGPAKRGPAKGNATHLNG